MLMDTVVNTLLFLNCYICLKGKNPDICANEKICKQFEEIRKIDHKKSTPPSTANLPTIDANSEECPAALNMAPEFPVDAVNSNEFDKYSAQSKETFEKAKKFGKILIGNHSRVYRIWEIFALFQMFLVSFGASR